MEASKRKAENGWFISDLQFLRDPPKKYGRNLSSIVPGTNGTNGDKKARLDPTCGTLVFCGATDFANMLKPGKLKEVF